MYLSISSGVGAEHDRVHGADVHHVAHRGGGAAVSGDRLADHRVGDVVLAQAAVLLGHREAQEPVLAEELEVAAREHQLVVEALGVRAELLLAELDQGGAELLLPIGVDPVRIPVVAQAPEGLRTPHLLGHRLLHVRAVPASAGSHPRFEGSGRATRRPRTRERGRPQPPPSPTRRRTDQPRPIALLAEQRHLLLVRHRRDVPVAERDLGLVLDGAPVEVQEHRGDEDADPRGTAGGR